MKRDDFTMKPAFTVIVRSAGRALEQNEPRGGIRRRRGPATRIGDRNRAPIGSLPGTEASSRPPRRSRAAREIRRPAPGPIFHSEMCCIVKSRFDVTPGATPPEFAGESRHGVNRVRNVARNGDCESERRERKDVAGKQPIWSLAPLM